MDVWAISVYDYYPFGMPLKERTVRDTATHIAYVMQSVQIPNIPGTSLQPNINGQVLWGYSASLIPAQAGSVWFYGQNGAWGRTVSGLIPYAPMDLSVGIGYVAAAPVTITVTEVVNGITAILQSVSGNSAGSYQLSFSPTGTQVQIEVSLNVSMATAQNLFSVTSVYYTQQNGYINVPQLVQLSNVSKDRYEFGFNGKYKDNEIAGMGNSLDFGARMYNPRIARWISLDPLQAKYPGLSPYQFVANSPLMFIDPDGKEIHVSFINENAMKLYKAIMNTGLEGQFQVKLTKTTDKEVRYNVTIDAIKGKGNYKSLTKEGKAFYDLLTTVTKDKQVVVNHDVVYDDPETYIGSFENNTLDIVDVSKFNPGGKSWKHTDITQQSTVAHEVKEQYLKAKAGLKKGDFALGATAQEKGENFSKNFHEPAILTENAVGGYERDINVGDPETQVDLYTRKDDKLTKTEVKTENCNEKSITVQQSPPTPTKK